MIDPRIEQTRENLLKWAEENVHSPNIVNRLFAQSMLESQKKTESTTASSSKVKGTTSSTPSKPSSGKKTTPPSKGKTSTEKTAPPPTSQTPPKTSTQPTPSYEDFAKLYDKGKLTWRLFGITSPEELQEKYEMIKSIKSGERKTSRKKDILSRYSSAISDIDKSLKSQLREYKKLIDDTSSAIKQYDKYIEQIKNSPDNSVWEIKITKTAPDGSTYEEVKRLRKDEALQFFEGEKRRLRLGLVKYMFSTAPTLASLYEQKKKLSSDKEKIEKLIRSGYHVKVEGNKIIFYKTPEEIQEEHYKEMQQEYKNLPDWMKIARGTSSAILWGWANPSFWAGLITGGVEGGRKAIAEAEWQWEQKYIKTGKAKNQPAQTWAETYFLSPPMTNVVYPISLSVIGGGALGAVSRVAPAIARPASLGLKYFGYGLLGYATYDVGKEVAQGKYKNALEKLIGYGMQFGSAYVGATSPIARVKIGETSTGQPIYKNVTPYEYGYIKASQYWTGKYPSTSYTIIKNMRVSKEGIKIIEGEHVTLGRTSLRSASITKTRFKGILKPDGTFQISKISGQIETYPLKKVGGRLKVVSDKVKTTPLSATDYSAKVNQIFLDIVNGRTIIKGSLLGGGRTKVSMRFFGGTIKSMGRGVKIRGQPVTIEGYLSEGKSIYRSFGIGKAGGRRFVSSSYTFAGRKTIKGLDLTTTRTKGAIFTEKGFADFINDYGLVVDLTKGTFSKAFTEFSSSVKVTGGGGRTATSMKKFIQAVQSGLASAKASATVTTPVVKPKFFVGLPGITSRAYATAYETVQEMMMYPPTAKIPSRPSTSTTLVRSIREERGRGHIPVVANVVKDMNKQGQAMLEFMRQLRKEQQENIVMNQRLTDTIQRKKEREEEMIGLKKVTASSLKSTGITPLFPFGYTPRFAPAFSIPMFGMLGNLRKSYKAMQRGILGYFNELKVALSLYYGERGEKKRRRRKR